MSKNQRQDRYNATGGAADLVKVASSVPEDSQARIFELAADPREEHRRSKAAVNTIIATVRAACARQPRRFSQPVDVDRIVITSVNVPFRNCIDAVGLAASLQGNTIPHLFAGHLERFLGELPLRDVLRFCDRHSISAEVLARYVRMHGKALALHRSDLVEHLNALIPHS
ncbi:MAG: hypothetical protein WCJ64_08905 [Rhodospirillaceae bacterium]